MSLTIEGLRTLSQEPNVSRAIVSKEHWLGGGTPHLQFAIWFRNPLVICKRFRKRYHLERAALERVKGSPSQMWFYCAKEGQDRNGQPLTPHNVEWGEEVIIQEGEPPHPGKRSDLQVVADALSSGSTPQDIAQDFTATAIRFSRGIENTYGLLQANAPRRLLELPSVLTLVGPTGTGKTARCQAFSAILKDQPYAWSAELGGFWENYYGQRFVHLEEFRGQLTRSCLLQILDRWPYILNRKGSSAHLQAHTFLISSPDIPYHWYKWGEDSDKADQLKRRLEGNKDSRIYHTGWDKFIDYQGNILDPQPEWGVWNKHSTKPMTTVH